MHIYARYRTRDAAEAGLEDCFATGEVFESELYGNGIKRIGKLWCIVLKTA